MLYIRSSYVLYYVRYACEISVLLSLFTHEKLFPLCKTRLSTIDHRGSGGSSETMNYTQKVSRYIFSSTARLITNSLGIPILLISNINSLSVISSRQIYLGENLMVITAVMTPRIVSTLWIVEEFLTTSFTNFKHLHLKYIHRNFKHSQSRLTPIPHHIRNISPSYVDQ